MTVEGEAEGQQPTLLYVTSWYGKFLGIEPAGTGTARATATIRLALNNHK